MNKTHNPNCDRGRESPQGEASPNLLSGGSPSLGPTLGDINHSDGNVGVAQSPAGEPPRQCQNCEGYGCIEGRYCDCSIGQMMMQDAVKRGEHVAVAYNHKTGKKEVFRDARHKPAEPSVPPATLIEQLMKLEARQWRDDQGKEITGAMWVRRDDVARMLNVPPATAGTPLDIVQPALNALDLESLRDMQAKISARIVELEGSVPAGGARELAREWMQSQLDDKTKLPFPILDVNSVLDWMAAYLAQAESRSYVKQDIAIECLEMLQSAGYGQPGKGNTLWAMVKQACSEVAELRQERDALKPVLDKLSEWAGATPLERLNRLILQWKERAEDFREQAEVRERAESALREAREALKKRDVLIADLNRHLAKG